MSGGPVCFYITPTDMENNNGSYYIWWEEEVAPDVDISEMFDNSPDNTWVFTGGADVEGGFAQTRGKRNFVGQFEEYIRWTKTANTDDGADPTRQRYTINTAEAGLTLYDVVNNWKDLAASYNPRAAAYMMQPGDSAESLRIFIGKALALRDDRGFAVIQTLNGEGDETVDSVVGAYSTDPGYARIVVIKHTLNGPQLTNGRPNGDGHYELGRQLAEAVFGSSADYPCAQGVAGFREAAQPDVYDTGTVPSVSFTEGVMRVTVNGAFGFTYELRLDSGVTVSGSAAGNTAGIRGLPDGKAYTLVARSADGSTQYKTTFGTVGIGAGLSGQTPAVDLSGSEPLTWLFIGDSITHGALWTKGYDSMSQTFDKYLDLLGRPQDVVVNTAVSGATAGSTLRAIEQRLNQYDPDVAAVMLGSNDAANAYNDGANYTANLESIIAAIEAKNPNAVIILRSPTGHWEGSSRSVGPYCEAMKAVAEKHGFIYVDQYTETQAALDTYSAWIKDGVNQLFYGNNLHPGALGQLVMAKMFIKAIGLWDEDNPIANLHYTATAAETSGMVPEISWTTADGAAILRLEPITACGQTTLSAAKDGQTWSITVKAGETAELAVPSGEYVVNVTAVSTTAAKTLTFAEQTVNTEDVSPGQPSGPIGFVRTL